MSDSTDLVLTSIRRTLRRLEVSTVVCYLAVFIIAGYVYVESSKTNDALCTFRTSIEDQASASRDFLTKHPKGIPGISAGTIRESIDRQEAAIVALSGLSC